MKQSKFSESQIVAILKEGDAGVAVAQRSVGPEAHAGAGT